MKKLRFPLALLLFSASSFYCHAQYGQKLQPGVNSDLNINTWNPTLEAIYTVDSNDVNEMNFGQKINKGSFKTIFAIKGVDANSKSLFSFKKSQITGTHITKNSGICNIELTREGFEVTYKARKKIGPVDDYVVVHTANGNFLLRLSGEIIASKKEEQQ